MKQENMNNLLGKKVRYRINFVPGGKQTTVDEVNVLFKGISNKPLYYVSLADGGFVPVDDCYFEESIV